MYKETEGDLIQMALDGTFDLIGHGVNCQNVQGAGIAKQMVEVFGTNNYPLEDKQFKADINKLGQIDYRQYFIENGKLYHWPSQGTDRSSVFVVNMYTQYDYGKNHLDGTDKPLDYAALRLCLKKMNNIFKGRNLGLPKVGAGLARGSWPVIKEMIKEECKDLNVTVVIYKN